MSEPTTHDLMHLPHVVAIRVGAQWTLYNYPRGSGEQAHLDAYPLFDQWGADELLVMARVRRIARPDVMWEHGPKPEQA